MNKNFTIREYRKDDEVSIMKLRGLVLSSSKDMDWWVWQHKQNPAGPAIISVAEDDDTKEIVGHNCVLPMKIKIEDKIDYTLAAVDTMVHPNYRRLGILKKLIQNNIEIEKKRNYAFSYAFPNLITSVINRRRGVKIIFKNRPLWIKPLKARNVVARYLNNNGMLTSLITAAGKGLMKLTDRSKNYQIRTQVKEVKEIDERFDTLWEQASSHNKIMLVRDRAYLDWRYVKKPDAQYTIFVSEDGDQLLGYIVLRNVEDNGLQTGWIVDILITLKDSPATMDLITKATQHFRTRKTDVILCIMPPKAYLAPSLKKQGFLSVSKWKRYAFFMSSTEMMQKYPDSLLFNPNNWFITRGDSDTI